MKKYHLAHHYKNFELGFGVTSEYSFVRVFRSVAAWSIESSYTFSLAPDQVRRDFKLRIRHPSFLPSFLSFLRFPIVLSHLLTRIYFPSSRQGLGLRFWDHAYRVNAACVITS